MPRRISDYPDFYTKWNQVASFGSTISIVSVFIFFYVIHDLLVYGKEDLHLSWKEDKLTCFYIKRLTLSHRALNNSWNCDTKHYDIPKQWGFNFQNPASPLMEGVIELHHDIMFFLIAIVFFVLWMLCRIILFFDQRNNGTPSNITHNIKLEIIWTTIPSLILLLLAIPSFSLLYAVDELINPEVTIKIIGNQWFWSYEHADINTEINFDSYMLLEEDLLKGAFRLLEVDNRLYLPIQTSIRVLISSTDVLHSFAIPSLACKMDACPGRLNQISLWINRTGVFYGQCSEICGINHGFMPIVVEGIMLKDFVQNISEKSNDRELNKLSAWWRVSEETPPPSSRKVHGNFWYALCNNDVLSSQAEPLSFSENVRKEQSRIPLQEVCQYCSVTKKTTPIIYPCSCEIYNKITWENVEWFTKELIVGGIIFYYIVYKMYKIF